jgi:hypothetical protein
MLYPGPHPEIRGPGVRERVSRPSTYSYHSDVSTPASSATMAKTDTKPSPARSWLWPVQTALDIANGKHELSSYLVILGWLSEIALIMLIIWRIPCATH